MKTKWKTSMRAAVITVTLTAVAGLPDLLAAGLLTPRDSNLPELEIRDHQVNVIMDNGYAITTVEQVFHNPHAQDLEAIYSFPVPEKAAVSEFTMWIDGKPIHGEVLEKKKAREVYEDQKAQNKSAGLTEKNEYKTFEISVFPVLAGQDTRIRLSYMQPAHVDTGIGRYVYPLEDGGVDDIALAFWSTNEKVVGTFSFDMVLRPGYPVNNVRLPNHPGAQITQKGEEWHIHFDNHLQSTTTQPSKDDTLTINNAAKDEAPLGGEEVSQNVTGDPAFRLDTDIVVYFRHAEGLPGSVDFIAYKEASDKRGTFMLTLTPGMDLKQLAGGRDWIFILDTSGSMSDKYATLAEGVSRALRSMNPNDRFRIVLFNSSAQELTCGFVTATPEHVKDYIDKVSSIKPNNGTNLFDGLHLGLKALDSDRTTSILLVTDGVANVGVTKQKQFIELLRKYDVRLFTFIMGNSANVPMLEALTRESNGFAISVSNSDDIIGKIMEAQSKVNFEAFHGANLKIAGVKTVDVTPEKIGSLYRGQQLVIFGHYFGSGAANVTLQGKISGEDKTYRTRFDFPDVATDNPEIERLWAYATVERLTQEIEDFGEEADLKQSIVDLGVEFGLVTDYTSMIVVEEDVFKQLGIDRSNQRRLEKEWKARESRNSQPIQSRRVDTNQPMFSGNRPTYSGGAGAFDPASLFLLTPLALRFRRGKNQKKTKV